MNRKTEVTIFFTALIMFGVVVVGGISYFKTQAQPDGLLADMTATIPSQNQATINTIPTSTIITPTAPAPSSTPLAPLTLPYVLNASTATSTYWPKAWSDVSFTDDSLALIPDPVHHGANTFLQGDASWTDYSVSADASWLMGGWFDIVARVSNNTQNFVYCEFGSNGTEIIERVNGNDTQLAATSASTTDEANTGENFGMKDDIACLMNDQEVVGARVQDSGESPAGGIGFVIFGAPQNQTQVVLTHVSVSKLSNDNIIFPFPVPLPPPPPAPIVIPPPVATTTPAPTPTPPPASTTPAPTPAPAPISATTTKSLPYAISIFAKAEGWNTYWGNFSIATNSLTMAASTDGTSAGALLDGTNAWTNYKFTATLDWVKGETFGLYARYANAQNYVLCYFDEPYLGDIQISLEEHVNGQEYTLAQGNVTDWNQWGGSNITASIQVQDSIGSCSINNHLISNYAHGNTLALPYTGKIGFTTWDPKKNNSEIIVTGIDAEENY